MSSILGGLDLGVAGSFIKHSQGNANTGINHGVNVATGNLFLSRQDGFLKSTGIDLSAVRVYNSRGEMDDNGGMHFGFAKLINLPTGTTRTPITLIMPDGTKREFRWDNEKNEYRAIRDKDAVDVLSAHGNGWKIEDGATDKVLHFHGNGLVDRIEDKEGNWVRYGFNNYRLARIWDDTQSIEITYNGDLISSVTSKEGTVVRSHIAYEHYDDGRVKARHVDLSPGDESVADANRLTTTYTYDGATNRIKTITQNDGRTVTITYGASQGRVSTITEGDSKLVFNYELQDGSRTYTRVTDERGGNTRYYFDGQGQIIEISGSPINGQRPVTKYTYNDRGQVETMTDSDDVVTTFSYDDNGNLTGEVTSTGKIIDRTFNDKNQILSESVNIYGSDQATTRYVYDDTGYELRFIIGPEGEITRYDYWTDGTGKGQVRYIREYEEAYTGAIDSGSLKNFTDNERSRTSSYSAYAYDVRGLVKLRLDYASTSPTGSGQDLRAYRFTYDHAGRLLVSSENDSRRNVNEYDAAGRLLFSENAEGARNTYAYLNGGATTQITTESGLVTTTTINSAGQIIHQGSVDALGQSFGSESRTYNARGLLSSITESDGSRSYRFYYENGLLQAEVSESGIATRYRYYDDGSLKSVREHANKINTQGYFQNGEVSFTDISNWLPSNAADDREIQYEYNADNQLTKEISPSGAITTHLYDRAGRRTYTAMQEPTTGELRESWTFYNGSGQVIGSVDPEGYVTANTYNGAGQLIQTTHYATRISTNAIAHGNWATVSVPSNSDDQTTRWLYDSAGQVIAEIDAEYYVTQTVYNDYGDVAEVIRYANRSSNPTSNNLASLAPAGDAADQRTRYTYNGLGLVATKIDSNGLITRNSYDAEGRLIKVVEEDGADKRATIMQYDAAGQVTGTVSGDIALTTDATNDVQVATAIRAQGSQSIYDSQGRAIKTLTPEGGISLNYFDIEGRLTHTIDAEGAINQNTFNALGDIIETRRLARTLTDNTLSSLQGGDASEIAALVAGLIDDSQDQISTFAYNTLGQVRFATKGGNTSETQYNAFGERKVFYDAEGYATTWTYDKRGLKRTEVTDSTNKNFRTAFDYDAFGRIIQVQDPKGFINSSLYDKLGRKTKSTDALNFSTEAIYDAFGRVLTTTDKKGNATSFDYSGQNRIETQTFADGSQIRQVQNAFGDVIETVDALGNATRFFYTDKGQLQYTLDAKNYVTAYEYDKNGQQVATHRYQAPIDTQVLTPSYDYVGNDNGTSFDRNPKVVGDVTGDGRDDIVFFKDQGVYVSTWNGTEFSPMDKWHDNYGHNASAGAWTSFDVFPRWLADINGDGLKDIVGFGGNVVTVSYSTGTSFTGQETLIADTGTPFDDTPKIIGDVTGDGREDIVIFKADGTYVSEWNGKSYKAFVKWSNVFGSSAQAGAWTDFNTFPRWLADINGDGRKDIVGFGGDRVVVAESDGSGFGEMKTLITDQGADFDKMPKMVSDVNGDNREDLIFFLADGAYVSFLEKDGYAEPVKWISKYGYSADGGSWATFDRYPRWFGDVNGDGVKDIVGFSGGLLTVTWATSLREAIETQTATMAKQSAFMVRDDLGRARFNVDEAGYITESIFDAFGQIIETKRYTEPKPELAKALTERVIWDSASEASQWQRYEGENTSEGIEKVWDEALQQKVISLTSHNGYNAFRLYDSEGNGDYDTTNPQTRISWQQSLNAGQVVYVGVNTDKGFRYITLAKGASEERVDGTYVYVRLEGQNINNTWQTFSLDLQEALDRVEPGVTINSVRSFLTRVKGRIANIKLGMEDAENWLSNHLQKSNAESQSIKIQYDEHGNITGQTDALGNAIEYSYDANGNVIVERRGLEPVSWTGMVNSTADGNQITKTNQDTNSYDSAAYSEQSIKNGEGSLSFKVPSTTSRLLIGLNDDGAASRSYGDMEYAMFFVQGDVIVFRNGSGGGFSQRHDPASTYRFLVEDRTVHYQVKAPGQDWETFYTGPTKLQSGVDYHADITMRHANDTVTDVTIQSGGATHYQYDALNRLARTTDPEGYVTEMDYDANGNVIAERRGLEPVSWTGMFNSAADGNQITKTNPDTDSYDSAAYSEQGIQNGEGSLSFKVPSTTSRLLIGLNDDGAASRSYGDMEYAMFFVQGDVIVFRNGSGGGVSQRHDPESTYRFLVDDYTVYFQVKAAGKDWETFYTGPTKLSEGVDYHADITMRHANDAVYDVYINSGGASQMEYDVKGNLIKQTDALGNAVEYGHDANGQVIETAIVELSDTTIWTKASSGVDASGSTVTKTTAGSSWSFGTQSAESLQHGQAIQFKAPDETVDLMVGLNGDSMVTGRYAEIDYALYIKRDRIRVYESDLYRGDFGAHHVDNTYRVLLDNGQVHYQVKSPAESEFTTFYTSTLLVDPEKSYRPQTDIFQSGGRIEQLAIVKSRTRSEYDANGNLIKQTDALGNAIEYAHNANGQVIETTVIELSDTTIWTKASSGVDTSGSTVTKTTAGSSWSFGTQSAESLQHGQAIQFKAPDETVDLMVGLNGDSMVTGRYAEIDYALYIKRDRIRVYESDLYRGDFGAHHVDNTYRVLLDNGQVHYQVKSPAESEFTTFYTSTILVDPEKSYRPQTDIFQSGGRIEQLAIVKSRTQSEYDARGNLIKQTDALGNAVEYGHDANGQVIETAIVELSDTTIWTKASSGVDASGSTVTKTTAGSSWSFGTQSAESLQHGQAIQFKAPDETVDLMVGLNGDSMVTGRYAEIDYALYIKRDRIRVYESDLYRGDFGAHHVDNTYRVLLDNGQVRYQVKGPDESEFTTFYTSTLLVDPEKSYRPQTDIFQSGGRIEQLAIVKSRTRSEYDANGNLIKQTDPLGHTESWTYDSSGNATSHTNKDGNTWTYTLDAKGQRIATTDPTGVTSTAAYDAEGRVIRETNGLGDTTLYTYDARGQLIAKQNALSEVETWRYDAQGNKTHYTNAAGSTWRYEYDAKGQLVVEIAPEDRHYYWQGEQLNHIDASLVKEYRYNAQGLVIEEISGQVEINGTRQEIPGLSQTVTKTRYNALGHSLGLTITRSLGTGDATTSENIREAQQLRDSQGRLLAERDPSGRLTASVFDVLGREVFAVDGDGYLTQHEYNAAGQIIKTTRYANALSGHLDRELSAYTLGSLANKASILASASDRWVRYQYDAQGQRIAVIESGGTETRWAYTASGQVAREDKLLGTTWNNPVHVASTRFVYNERGEKVMSLVSKDAEFAYVNTWSYDAAGQVIRQVEHASPIARSILDSDTLPSIPSENPTVTGYDRVVENTYDVLGRVEETKTRILEDNDTGTSANSPSWFIVTNEYDAAGQLVQVDNHGRVTNYLYNKAGQLIQETGPAQSFVNDSDVAVQAGTQFTTPTASVSRVVTDLRLSVEGHVLVKREQAGTTVRESQQQYDTFGLLSQVKDAAGNIRNFTYNESGLKISESYTLENGSGQNQQVRTLYEYDERGNIVQTRLESAAVGASSWNLVQIQSQHHNAFGELVAKDERPYSALYYALKNGQRPLEQRFYDAKGRLERIETRFTRKSEGDILVERFSYTMTDLGEQTTRYVDGQGSTDSIVNHFGNVVLERDAAWTQDGIVRRVVREQSLDRWGNVLEQVERYGDTSRTFNSRYNTRNQVIFNQAPLVNVVDEDGSVNSIRPQERFGFNAHGQAIWHSKAEGERTATAGDYTEFKYYNEAGMLIADVNGEGDRRDYWRNGFGDQLAEINGVGDIQITQRDALGRVAEQGYISVTTTGNFQTGFEEVLYYRSVAEYSYNAMGKRIEEVRHLKYNQSATNTYDYNAQGLQTQSKIQTGNGRYRTSETEYNARGQKVSHTDDISTARSLSWTYDADGTLVSSDDLGGNTTTYFYDTKGRLRLQRLELSDRVSTNEFFYYDNGWAYSQRFDKDSVHERYARYRYHESGQHERVYYTSNRRDNQEGNTGQFIPLKETVHFEYDALHRLQRMHSQREGLSGAEVEALYAYDANNNRRRVQINHTYTPDLENRAPEVSAPTSTIIEAFLNSEPFTFELEKSVFFDRDGDQLSFSHVNATSGIDAKGWVTMQQTSEKLIFQADPTDVTFFTGGEPFAVTVKAEDPDGLSVTHTVYFRLRDALSGGGDTGGGGTIGIKPPGGESGVGGIGGGTLSNEFGGNFNTIGGSFDTLSSMATLQLGSPLTLNQSLSSNTLSSSEPTTLSSGSLSGFTTTTSTASTTESTLQTQTSEEEDAISTGNQDYWYTYDAADRLIVSEGVMVGDSIQLQNNKGQFYDYDAAGRIELRGSNRNVSRFAYDEAGNQIGSFAFLNFSDSGLDMLNADDRAHALAYRIVVPTGDSIAGSLFDLIGNLDGDDQPEGPNPWIITNRSRYDLQGRVTQKSQWITYDNATWYQPPDGNTGIEPEPINGGFTQPGAIDGTIYAAAIQRYSYTYDGRILQENRYKDLDSNGEIIINGTDVDNTNGYNQHETDGSTRYFYLSDGNLDYVDSVKHDYAQYTAYTRRAYTYQYRESALADVITRSEVGPIGDFYDITPGRSRHFYNGAGQLVQVTELAGDAPVDAIDGPNRVLYTHNAAGQMLVRQHQRLRSGEYIDKTDSSDRMHHFYAGQQHLGKISGKAYVMWTPPGKPTGQTDESPLLTTVQPGDSLATIAQRVLGNTSFWYVIADANGLSGTDPHSTLDAGIRLQVPAVSASQNSAGTFTPFNPASAIGDTAIAAPIYSGKDKAFIRVFSAFVLAAIAIVSFHLATYMVSNIYAQAALGGAMSSIGQQGYNMAMGYQEDFSWRQVRASAFTAVATAGIGQGLKELNFAKDSAFKHQFVRGGLNYLAGNLVNKAVDPDNAASFDWNALAAEAFSSGFTGTSKTDNPKGHLDIRENLLNNLIEARVQRFLNGGGKEDWAQILGKSMGQTAAQGLVEGLREKRYWEQYREAFEAWADKKTSERDLDKSLGNAVSSNMAVTPKPKNAVKLKVPISMAGASALTEIEISREEYGEIKQAQRAKGRAETLDDFIAETKRLEIETALAVKSSEMMLQARMSELETGSTQLEYGSIYGNDFVQSTKDNPHGLDEFSIAAVEAYFYFGKLDGPEGHPGIDIEHFSYYELMHLADVMPRVHEERLAAQTSYDTQFSLESISDAEIKAQQARKRLAHYENQMSPFHYQLALSVQDGLTVVAGPEIFVAKLAGPLGKLFNAIGTHTLSANTMRNIQTGMLLQRSMHAQAVIATRASISYDAKSMEDVVIKNRVLSNLEHSRVARESSNFKAENVGLPSREWPPFPGTIAQIEGDFTLLPGTLIDRFGSPRGSFLSPVGTNYSQRALIPGTSRKDFYVYEVLRPLEVKVGEVRPWFGESGGGLQYRLDAVDGVRRSPQSLITGENPYLKQIYRGKYGDYKR